MLCWVMRCLPGLSIIILLVLLVGAFTDSLGPASWNWLYLSPKNRLEQQEGPWKGLNIAQCVFISYTIFVHLNMFGFTCRLAWSIYRAIGDANLALNVIYCSTALQGKTTTHIEKSVSRISVDISGSLNEKSYRRDPLANDGFEKKLVHAIILPNYREDMWTLETTLRVLASHPQAKAQYEVYIAMEQKEETAADKAAHLVSLFGKSFFGIRWTSHPAGIPGEISGKGSNVAFAARRIMEIHSADLKKDCCNVVVTIMDADTHISRCYFNEIGRLHHAHFPDAARTIYCCPIIFDRNAHETPVILVTGAPHADALKRNG